METMKGVRSRFYQHPELPEYIDAHIHGASISIEPYSAGINIVLTTKGETGSGKISLNLYDITIADLLRAAANTM